MTPHGGLTLGPPFPFALGGGGLVPPLPAATRSFYVDPAGSDLAAGTSPGSAWKTLQRAAAREWLPGEELVVLGSLSGIDATLDFFGGGDPARPVVIRGASAASRPTLTFASGMSESPKFNVAGVGFEVRDLIVTQSTKGATAADRMVVAQKSQDGNHTPSDVVFQNVAAATGYELFKASGFVQRVRFVGCTATDATIAGGIAGGADDCSFEFCDITDCDEGIQTKGGCRNPLLLGNRLYGAFANGALALGGSSTFEPGDDWGRKDGTAECFNGLAVANLIAAGPGQYTNTGILLRGAANCRIAYNTIANMDGTTHYTDGIEDGVTARASGGSGWDLGAPGNSGNVVEQNLFRRITTTIYSRAGGGSGHVARNNSYHLCDWVTEAGDQSGTWTFSGGDATRDPKFAAVPAAAADFVGELASDSPERGAGTPLLHAWFGGTSPHQYAVDRLNRARGSSAWHRGAMETP